MPVATARRMPRPGEETAGARLAGQRLSVALAELEQVVPPERPDDDAAHEAGGQRGEQDGHDHAEVELAMVGGIMRAPGRAHHATPDRRRQRIPPSSSAKAATGSITNAAVNNVIRSRMAFRSSHTPHFARRVPHPSDLRLAQKISGLGGIVGRDAAESGEDLLGLAERKLAGRRGARKHPLVRRQRDVAHCHSRGDRSNRVALGPRPQQARRWSTQ